MPWSVDVPGIRLFSDEELDAIGDAVFSLRSEWVDRGGVGLYTLGSASYHDADRLRADVAAIAPTNELIDTHFSGALRRLLLFLEVYLKGSVRFSDELPRPGFHIFDARAIAVGETTLTPHFDLQHLDWDFGASPTSFASVTVAIEVPTGGLSFDYWSVDFDEFQELLRTGAIRGVEDLSEFQRISYSPGHACVQLGLPLHRVGPSAAVDPGDYRITLQCHAVQVANSWIVYW